MQMLENTLGDFFRSGPKNTRVGRSKSGGTIAQDSTPLPGQREALEGHHQRS
jgi:hypothetical protein